MDLQEKVIVITGGARGIGFAIAEHLASRGATLALVDLDPSAVEQAAGKLPKAKGYVANVTDEDQVVSLFKQVVNDYGRLDGLVNNAGIMKDGLMIKLKDGQMTKMSLDQWQAVIDVNLTGVFLCGREAAANMAELGNGGVIVNISSVSRSGNFGQTNYSATKSAVCAMMVTWAKELARYGIRTGAVAPGFIETDMTAQMPPEVLGKITKQVPLQRMGTTTDIAESVRFIFENEYFTGRVIETDGGARL